MAAAFEHGQGRVGQEPPVLLAADDGHEAILAPPDDQRRVRHPGKEPAETRVRRSLVLNRVADLEKIEPANEEIDAEVDKLIGPMGEDGERFRALFAGEEGRGTIRRNLVTQKTFDRISAIAAGEAGAEAEEATV